MEEVQHTDKCCSWDDPEFCDCGARAIDSLEQQLSAANSQISQLRHDLLNEQAASRMAHEVVARNRALEKELVETQEQLEVWRNDERQRCMDVARLFEVNSALEAENAQLRHALANAQVAAGFAKEMVEKVKILETERAALAESIGNALTNCGICNPIPMTGPELIFSMGGLERMAMDRQDR